MKLTGFKEWKINEKLMIRFHIAEWFAGFYIGRWTWIHIPLFSLCINFTHEPMYGKEEEYVE